MVSQCPACWPPSRSEGGSINTQLRFWTLVDQSLHDSIMDMGVQGGMNIWGKGGGSNAFQTQPVRNCFLTHGTILISASLFVYSRILTSPCSDEGCCSQLPRHLGSHQDQRETHSLLPSWRGGNEWKRDQGTILSKCQSKGNIDYVNQKCEPVAQHGAFQNERSLLTLQDCLEVRGPIKKAIHSSHLTMQYHTKTL